MTASVTIIQEVIFDAAGNLRALRGRTALALLGISIGTAAVIAMLHVGHNARMQAMRQFETLGVDLVSITPQGIGTQPTIIPLQTAYDLSGAAIGLTTVAPFILGGTSIRVGGHSISANLVATTDGLYDLAKAQIATGRRTSVLDGFAAYAVIGSDILDEIHAASGNPVKPGDPLAVDDQVLTIIGILARTPPNMILNLDLNRSIIIPFAAVRRLIPDPHITNIAARLSSGADAQATAELVTRYLSARLRIGQVNVQTARQLIDGLDQQMRVYGLLLLAIGAVALIVGGVGVMNVMLMSVMERQREIGVRLAIGARRRDIRTMFITEALLLSGAGSIVGTLLGTIAGWIFCDVSGWSFDAAPTALPLGAGMALIVGLFFGSYPAARAAQLDPIAALRAE